jgi:hypothetical protein
MNQNRFITGLVLYVLAMFFLIMASFYSFALIKVGFADEDVLQRTFAYHTLGVFFSFLTLLCIVLMIVYVVKAGAEEVEQYV